MFHQHETKVRINELSGLDNALWKAFRSAQKTDLPSAFNPWRVTRTFFRLRAAGRLKLYDFYPAYAILSVAIFAYVHFANHQLFMFTAMIPCLPLFIALSRYVTAFTADRSQMEGLAKNSFGVPHLALLANGVAQAYNDRVPDKNAAASAPLTKANLASVLKLVKGGHDHGDVSIGLMDGIKKKFFSLVAAGVGLMFTRTVELQAILTKVTDAVRHQAWLVPALFFMLFGLAQVVYGLVFSSAVEKRQKRLYLQVLTTLYEGWVEKTSEETTLEVLPQVQAGLAEVDEIAAKSKIVRPLSAGAERAEDLG